MASKKRHIKKVIFSSVVPKKFKLILTGGYAHLFIKSIKQKAYIDKDITIKGLLKITELL